MALSPSRDLTDWTCQAQAKDKDGNILFTKNVNTTVDNNQTFSQLINEADSRLLVTGIVTIGYEIKNATTGECSSGVIVITVDPDPID